MLFVYMRYHCCLLASCALVVLTRRCMGMFDVRQSQGFNPVLRMGVKRKMDVVLNEAGGMMKTGPMTNRNITQKATATLTVCMGMLLASYNAQAAGEARSIDLGGGLQLTPTLGVSYKHNDNIFSSTTNRKSSNITVFDPSLALQAGDDINNLALSYDISRGIYHNSRRDDYTDHNVKFDANKEFTRRLQAGLAAYYKKSHDARGSTFTGLAITNPNPDRYHETGVSTTIGYGVNGRITLIGDYSNKRYENNRVTTITRDLDTMGGDFTFAYPIAPKTDAVIEARYKRFDYKYLTATTNLDSNEQTYYGGLDWQATAKTSGSLRLGYMKKRFNSARMTGGNGFSWELGMDWAPKTYSTVTLQTKGGFTETDGTGSFLKTQGGSLSWQHEWSEKFGHHASASYTENKYVGTALGRKDKLSTVGFGVDYQIVRWLGIDLAYDHSTRRSNAANSSYNSNIYSINLTGTL
ncbi:hypothetical protein FEF65_09550 [Mariprofundus erugo]|uniref:TIGR03016 family PEP-CTERM system-associated outer membrane protein n=2 Tax=Mariprofundus erugo TaxID=2528639 RepID=A0A5R9GNV8_9PROT|nr:hypothetical protein FEF65_09550 [Mariprofundus erugo]